MRVAKTKLSQRIRKTFYYQMKFLILTLSAMLCIGAPTVRADDVAQSRARQGTIEKAVPQLKPIVKRDLDGYSGERGELRAYFQNGVPRKMVARHYFNTFRRIDELYFWQGRLFFVIETKETYDMSTAASSNIRKIMSSGKMRFYFKNGKLWRWNDEEVRIIERGAEFKAHERETLNFARQMLAGARSKTKVIVSP